MAWTAPPGPYNLLVLALKHALGLAGRESEVILWDVASGRPRARRRTAGTDLIADVAFSPDGRIVAAGGPQNTRPR
jgi:hypothetical protein